MARGLGYVYKRQTLHLDLSDERKAQMVEDFPELFEVIDEEKEVVPENKEAGLSIETQEAKAPRTKRK
jgi:hypothetical protein